MKPKFYTTVLVIGFLNFALNSFATEKSKPRAIKLHYENTGGEKGISYFGYDGNGRMVKGMWELLDKSQWSTLFFIYTEKGQLAEKYREFFDNSTSSLKYEYNEMGKPTAEIFWRTDGREGTTTFTYDEKGFLSGADCHKYYGWIDGRMVFVCDDQGNKKSAKLYKDDKLYANVTFDYDVDDNLLKEYWEFTVNWSQTFVYEYETSKPSYTSSNVFMPENSRFRLVKENYSFNGKTGGPSSYKYDENGKLFEKIYYVSDSLNTLTTFKYDGNGLLTESIRKYSDGGVGKFTYEFTPLRKIQKRHFKNSDRKTSEEEYFYDKSGKLISAKWNNFDDWLTGELTFQYSRSNLLKSGRFTGDDGTNAELMFEYDIDGNLFHILWKFNSGESQDYWFEYSRLY